MVVVSVMLCAITGVATIMANDIIASLFMFIISLCETLALRDAPVAARPI
jgi:hypothetical protein